MNLTLRLLQSIVFLAPLFFLPFTHQVFELNKLALFQIFLSLAGFTFLWECVIQKQEINIAIVKNKTIQMAFIASALILIVGTLFSLSPHLSFWGSYSRHQGALTFLWIMLFFLLLSTQLKSDKSRESLLKTMIASATLVSLYGIVQKLGFDFMDWQDDALMGRVASSLGHPNYLGQFLLITSLLTLYFIFQKKHIPIVLIALGFQWITLFFTMNRGAIIGLIVGLIALIFTKFRRLKNKKGLWASMVIGFIAVFTFLSAQIFHFSRFDFTNPENLRSIQTRAVLWENSLELVKESTFVGYGFDTFKLAFTPLFSKELLLHENISELPDRAHNEILDLLIQIGLLGTLIYYGFAMTWMVWALRQKNALQDVCVATFIGSTIANQFGFYTLIHYLLLISLLTISLTAGLKIKTQKIPHIKFLLAPAFIILLIPLWMGSKKIYADHQFKKALSSIPPDIENLKKVKALEPHYNEYSITYVGNALLQPQNVNAHIPEIAKTLETLNQRNPQDHQVYELAGYLAALQENKENVVFNFETASELAPNVPSVYKWWAESLYIVQEYSDAIEKYEHYLWLLPEDWKGNDPEKKRIFLKLNHDFPKTLENIIELYKKVGNIEKAEYYKDVGTHNQVY